MLLNSTAAALMALMPFSASAQDTPAKGGDIVVTYKDDITTLDPAIGYDWVNWSMIKSLFETGNVAAAQRIIAAGGGALPAGSDDGQIFRCRGMHKGDFCLFAPGFARCHGVEAQKHVHCICQHLLLLWGGQWGSPHGQLGPESE